MHLRPLNPKRVIQESLIAGGILKSFSQENRGQNTVRSGIHDIACTGVSLTG